VTAQVEHSIDITVKPFEHSLIEKNYLVFVEAMPRLYFPFDDSLPPSMNADLLELLERYVEHRRFLESEDYHYSAINYMMPQQRFFHRTRVSDFRRMTVAEYRAELAARAAIS
jgi:hypothetical protein